MSTDRVGIVLAGGHGRRLGAGRPKALASLAGATLLERAVRTLAAVSGRVLVVAPDALDLGAMGAIVATDARRVADAPGYEGPLAGLVAGLEAAGDAASLVLGVDFPCVTPATLQDLAERLARAPHADAVVPRQQGIEQPLVAAYASSAAAKLRAALEAGETSLRGGLRALAVGWVDDVASLPGGPEALLNVNTPDDLERARRRLAAGIGSAP